MTTSAPSGILPLSVQGLHKAYGKKSVLHGFDMEAAPATVTAILGSNGSGKSTFMRCLLGLHVPDSGRISVMGDDTGKAPPIGDTLATCPKLRASLKT